MALSGIRVVDLTRVLAGPFCTMLLADMGAEVIKVESPKGGDPVRHQATIKDGLSWYFASFNRNKRSLAVDLRTAEGKEILAELIRASDVLVENFRPGVLDQMGFDAARLETLNPRLVTASINGFGGHGPYAQRPAVDFVAQAMSGFMSVNGREGEPPLRCAPPISDLIAGVYAAFGIVSALHARNATGRGQRVEASLTNALISMLAYLSAEYFVTGELPKRTGNDHPVVAPYGLFRAADGDIAVAPANDALLRRLMDALELGHLLDDPRCDTNEKRVARRAEINALIDERVGERTRDDWIERLNRAGVPCGRVLNLAEVFEDPQVRAQDMVLDVDHPGHGTVRMTGFPVKMSATPCEVRRPAPELGEHTDAVLRSLGVAEAEIARLRARGVVA